MRLRLRERQPLGADSEVLTTMEVVGRWGEYVDLEANSMLFVCFRRLICRHVQNVIASQRPLRVRYYVVRGGRDMSRPYSQRGWVMSKRIRSPVPVRSSGRCDGRRFHIRESGVSARDVAVDRRA